MLGFVFFFLPYLVPKYTVLKKSFDAPLGQLGRILNYPTGFACPKCQNTGYKASDPERPCRRVRVNYLKWRTSKKKESHRRLTVLAQIR